MKKCINLSIGTTTIAKKLDTDPDTSYLGEYGDTPKPGCLIIQDQKIYEEVINDEDYEFQGRSHNYRFFYPPDNGEIPGSDMYRKCVLEDYQNMEDLNNSQWTFIAIIVKTEIVGKIPSIKDGGKYTEISDHIINSLWGIEDHFDKDSKAYIEETINELKGDNKTELLKMGFSESEIDQSLNNAEIKEEW